MGTACCVLVGVKKATDLTEEPPPAQNKSNVKLNASICLSYMNITCKKING